MPATLRWRDRMGLLMRQRKWKYLSRSWGFWRTQLLEILAGSMQEASNLTGCFWGCCAWGARLSTGRGTKSTSFFGICQVSVGHIGIRWILHPVVHLGGQWLVSGAHDKALAAFLQQARNSQAQKESELRSCRKIWKQGLECSGGDFRSAQWIGFPCRPAPGHVVGTFQAACCWPAQQPWSESWMTFSVRIEVITQTCSRYQNHILAPT